MTSVGERLHRERVRQGIDLTTLARSTRIRPKFLQAIESGRVEELPGAFFYVSFARQYALALQVDTRELEHELEQVRASGAEALEAALRQQTEPRNTMDPIEIETRRGFKKSTREWGSVLLLAVVIAACSAVYGWWTRQLESQTASAAVTRASDAEPLANWRAAASAVPPRIPQSASLRARYPARRAAATPRADAGAAKAAHDERVVVELAANEQVWISASSQGKRLYAGLLGPSDSKVLTSDTQFRIRIGNAGGLEITWNGKSLGTLGSKGQVRDIVFTADNYRVLSPNDSL